MVTASHSSETPIPQSEKLAWNSLNSSNNNKKIVATSISWALSVPGSLLTIWVDYVIYSSQPGVTNEDEILTSTTLVIHIHSLTLEK